MQNKVRRTTLILGATKVLAIAGILLFSVPVYAQNAALEEAKSVYNDGNYEEAASLFSGLAQDTSLDKVTRREAMQYLGRAHIANSKMEEARDAVAQLLALEPPLIELNPDIEPPPLMDLYYDVRDNLEVPKEDPGMQTLAIMDFRNYVMDPEERDFYEPMQWGFSSMMIEQLSGATDMKLVDRENLQWILAELDLQKEPGRVDQATAVRMGKLMGAHAMVFGNIYKTGRKMRLSARLVKVETGEILLGESVEGKEKDFYELLEKLSLKVARSINSTISATAIGERTETKSLDAMRAYSEGLDLLEKNEYQGAYEKFLEAKNFDPNYSRAALKAESIRPLLAVRSDTGGVGVSEGF